MKHVTYEIVQDDCPLNPRDEFDNLSRFYGPSESHYLVGGKHDLALNHYVLPNYIEDFRKEKAIIVEFQSDAGTCYAVVERSQLQKEYLDYGYSMRKALYHARQCAKGEIETWLAYCNGEVYGYIVKDNEGETIDSIWGYYGREFCEEEAKSSAEWHEAEIEKKLQEQEAELNRRMELAAS